MTFQLKKRRAPSKNPWNHAKRHIVKWRLVYLILRSKVVKIKNFFSCTVNDTVSVFQLSQAQEKIKGKGAKWQKINRSEVKKQKEKSKKSISRRKKRQILLLSVLLSIRSFRHDYTRSFMVAYLRMQNRYHILLTTVLFFLTNQSALSTRLL